MQSCNILNCNYCACLHCIEYYICAYVIIEALNIARFQLMALAMAHFLIQLARSKARALVADANFPSCTK